MQRRSGETQTEARAIFLPPMGKQQTLAKKLSSADTRYLRCILDRHRYASQQAEIGAAEAFTQTACNPCVKIRAHNRSGRPEFDAVTGDIPRASMQPRSLDTKAPRADC